VKIWSRVCSGTGTSLGWSYPSHTIPLPTVLRCYGYCTPPNATPSCVARRLSPTDPNLNISTSGGGVGNPSGAAASQPAPSTTTSTSQQPRYYRPPRITASSNSNRTSGGSGHDDNDDGLGGIAPPSLQVCFFVPFIITKTVLTLKLLL